jgi:tetratricopeptide (TPR) repeat protein
MKNNAGVFLILVQLIGMPSVLLAHGKGHSEKNPTFAESPVNGNASEMNAHIRFFEERRKKGAAGGIDLGDLALLYVKRGMRNHFIRDIERAEKTANESLKSLPVSNVPARMALAHVASFRHRFDEAIGLARLVLAERKDNSQAVLILVTSLRAKGNLKEALEAADRLLRIQPAMRGHVERAIIQEALGNSVSAEKDFMKALEKEDVDEAETAAWAYTLYARFHARLGHNQKASSLIARAFGKIPDYPLAKQVAGEFRLGL